MRHSLATELQKTKIVNVLIAEDALAVELADGHTVAAPIEWYPDWRMA